MSAPLIDPELRALIPALTGAERDQLEASLLAEGCRDALVVWSGHDVLLDGHHRLEICDRLGLDYCTTAVDLPHRTAAKAWIIRHQFGRRNLTPYQRAELALLLEPLIAAEAKERQREGGRQKVPQDLAEPRETREELARLVGVSRETLRLANVIRDRGDNDIKTRVRTGELSIHMGYRRVKRAEDVAQRDARRQENAARVAAAPSVAIAVARARFATIVADPPWSYDNADLYGPGLPEYASMSHDDLKALPVADRADEDAHLYRWTTNPKLPEAFELLDAWGFRYAGFVTWCKPRFGMGRYFRSQTEHVLFGVKGSLPLRRKDVGTWFEAPRGRHSAKPEKFFEIVESCSPGPYLELFARTERAGWTAWGGEL